MIRAANKNDCSTAVGLITKVIINFDTWITCFLKKTHAKSFQPVTTFAYHVIHIMWFTSFLKPSSYGIQLESNWNLIENYFSIWYLLDDISNDTYWNLIGKMVPIYFSIFFHMSIEKIDTSRAVPLECSVLFLPRARRPGIEISTEEPEAETSFRRRAPMVGG